MQLTPVPAFQRLASTLPVARNNAAAQAVMNCSSPVDSISLRFAAQVSQAQVNEDVNAASGVFTKNVLTTIADRATTENTVISPANTFLLLNLLNTGASGKCRDEISKVMGLSTNPDKDQVAEGFKNYIGEFGQIMKETGITLQQSFGVWARGGEAWHPDFSRRLAVLEGEKGELTGADAINDWAAKKTNDKIKTIVSEQDVATAKAVLASATYLLSNWRQEFDENKTWEMPFNGLKSTTNVKMMNTEDDFVFDQSHDQYEMVRLPYGKKSDSGRELSMSLFLPKKGEDLKSVYNALFANGEIDQALKTLNTGRADELQLTMPKFVVESETDTKDVLAKMGINKAFGSEAQFDEMLQRSDIYVDKMKQKAFIDVNEKGTEAAAVDVAVLKCLSAKMTPSMVFDKPFVSVIHDDKGRILFATTITDLPEAEKKAGSSTPEPGLEGGELE